jgi:hypothetical protein
MSKELLWGFVSGKFPLASVRPVEREKFPLAAMRPMSGKAMPFWKLCVTLAAHRAAQPQEGDVAN